jgi:hypothetical protein
MMKIYHIERLPAAAKRRVQLVAHTHARARGLSQLRSAAVLTKRHLVELAV